MESYKPEIGDTVIICKGRQRWNQQGKMDKWIGTKQTIRSIENRDIYFVGGGGRHEEGINSWSWRVEDGSVKPFQTKNLVLKLKIKN